MPDEYDFSELRNYISGQIDLGGADLLLDEPWAPVKPNRVVKAPPRVTPVAPAAPQPARAPEPPARPAAAPAPQQPAVAGFDVPSARPVKKSVSAYEGTETLDGFYGAIAGEAVYSGSAPLVRYEGPEHPRLLLLFAAPRPEIPAGSFFSTSTGSMLSKLFASLKIEQSEIGVSYFYKSTTSRNIPPLLEAALRKMLTKELSFIQPQVMVTFGEPLFHQVFGRGKVFNDCAGTDMDFGGVKACALVDAFAMESDKQLKLVTWKVHIPRGTYFKN